MRGVRLAGIVTVALLGMASMAAPAGAGECRVACSRAKQVCVTAIKQAKAACRQECANARDGGSPGGAFPGCLSLCRDDFAAAKTTCKGAFAECRTACIPGGGGGGGGDPACADGCGQQGRVCLQGVRDQAVSCGTDCQTTARAAMAACRASAEPLRCLLEAGRNLAQCLGGCAEAGLTGGRVCTTDLRSCLAGCAGGSPSPAFIH